VSGIAVFRPCGWSFINFPQRALYQFVWLIPPPGAIIRQNDADLCTPPAGEETIAVQGTFGSERIRVEHRWGDRRGPGGQAEAVQDLSGSLRADESRIRFACAYHNGDTPGTYDVLMPKLLRGVTRNNLGIMGRLPGMAANRGPL
jgi:hypothetical protein